MPTGVGCPAEVSSREPIRSVRGGSSEHSPAPRKSCALCYEVDGDTLRTKALNWICKGVGLMLFIIPLKKKQEKDPPKLQGCFIRIWARTWMQSSDSTVTNTHSHREPVWQTSCVCMLLICLSYGVQHVSLSLFYSSHLMSCQAVALSPPCCCESDEAVLSSALHSVFPGNNFSVLSWKRVVLSQGGEDKVVRYSPSLLPMLH